MPKTSLVSVVHFASIVIAQLLAGILGSSLNAQERTIDLVDKDFGQLVDSLENRNPEPKIIGEGPSQKPLFSKQYDWNEQERVLKTIQVLVDHANVAWPALVDHLEDKRYCITVRYGQSVGHFSVGSVCRDLITRDLTEAYVSHIPLPEERLPYVNRLRDPDILPRKAFKKWCIEQRKKGKELYELQIDLCEWAIQEIRDISDIPKSDREASVAKIKEEIEMLRSEKKPVLIKQFTDPEFKSVYSRKDAEQIRRRIEGDK